MTLALIAELRQHQRDYPSLIHAELCGRAADEIERIRAILPSRVVEAERDDLIKRLHASADACEFTMRSKLLREAADALAEATTKEFSVILHTLQDVLCPNGQECRECECLAPALTASIIRALGLDPGEPRRFDDGNQGSPVKVGAPPAPGAQLAAMQAALERLLSACIREFGWMPDIQPTERVTQDHECQITWGDLHQADSALRFRLSDGREG